MENRILCGSYHVSNKSEFTDSSFECAAWWRTISVEPGDYPVYGYLEGSSLHLYAHLEGTIVADSFQSLFCGNPIGEHYDEQQNAGKTATYMRIGRDYEVLADMREKGDQSPWKIDLSAIPYTLSTCSDCGGVIHKHPISTRCPGCSVRRQQELRNRACRRHRFLLATGYALRSSRDSGYLDSVIAEANYDQSSMRDYYGSIMRVEIAAMRAAGPRGRVAARQKYPVPAYVFAVC